MPQGYGQEFADGMDFFIDNYLRPADDEAIILLYTSACSEILIQLVARLLLRRYKVEKVWMHPREDVGLTSRLRDACTALGPADWPRLLAVTLEDESFSHSSVIDMALRGQGFSSARTVRLISACRELFETAAQAAPPLLSARNAHVLRKLLPLREISVTTAGGSNLALELDSARMRWISNRGVATVGRGVILPAGEVATCPSRVQGTFVADFAYNMNCHTTVDARLCDHPVTLEIRDSRVASFTCDDTDVAGLLDQTLSMAHGDRIGELGFGTNPRVVKPIARNSHINERHCGIHLGLGQHNQDERTVDYYCPIHLDLIASGGRVFNGEGEVILDLAQLPLVTNDRQHQFGDYSVLDEDVFSPSETRVEEEVDCCGGDLCLPHAHELKST